MKKLTRTLLAAVCVTSISLPAFAVLPDSGMWTIGDELDGKPGRGIQVDRQGGKTLIVSYFGYRADGSSLFLQASGQLQQGKVFTADLVEYKNGRILGGKKQSGEQAQVAGPISIAFETTTTGTITLPGEAPQRISRFQFEDNKPRLNFTFTAVANTRYAALAPSGTMQISASGNTLQIQETLSSGDKCSYTGDLVPAGKGFRSLGSMACNFANAPARYELEDLAVDEYGTLSGRLYWVTGGSTGGFDSYTYTLRSVLGICRESNSADNSSPPNRCSPEALGFTVEDLIK